MEKSIDLKDILIEQGFVNVKNINENNVFKKELLCIKLLNGYYEVGFINNYTFVPFDKPFKNPNTEKEINTHLQSLIKELCTNQ